MVEAFHAVAALSAVARPWWPPHVARGAVGICDASSVELWCSTVVQARSFRIFVMEKLRWWWDVGQDWSVIGCNWVVIGYLSMEGRLHSTHRGWED